MAIIVCPLRKVSIWYIETCPLFGGYFYCVPYSECPLSSEIPLYRKAIILFSPSEDNLTKWLIPSNSIWGGPRYIRLLCTMNGFTMAIYNIIIMIDTKNK